MNFDRKLFQRMLILLSMVAVFAVVLRLFTYWQELDPATSFFRASAPACLIYNGIGFVVFFLCLALSMKKGGDASDVPDASEALTPYYEEDDRDEKGFFEEQENEELQGDSLPDFSRRVATWEGTLTAFLSFLPGFGFIAYSLSSFTKTAVVSDPYRMIFAVLSALSGLSFLYLTLKNSGKADRVRPFLALIPCFWCTARLVVEYRDLARFVNKTLYIGQFLFIISALVFFLYHAQLLFGEKALTRPNAYAFSALAVVFFGVSCRIPQLIAVFGDRAIVDLVDASSLFIDLALTLFAAMKIAVGMRDKNRIF